MNPQSRILAVDPGTEKSAFVLVTGPGEPMQILAKGILPNEQLRCIISSGELRPEGSYEPVVITDFAIEMVASYGMAVGQTTFETVFWIGRFWEAAHAAGIARMARLFRKSDIAMHLCQSMRAKDANVRQALIDRFGEQGTKIKPGVLYKVGTHEWSALAVATVYRDRLEGVK